MPHQQSNEMTKLKTLPTKNVTWNFVRPRFKHTFYTQAWRQLKRESHSSTRWGISWRGVEQCSVVAVCFFASSPLINISEMSSSSFCVRFSDSRAEHTESLALMVERVTHHGKKRGKKRWKFHRFSIRLLSVQLPTREKKRVVQVMTIKSSEIIDTQRILLLL